MQVKKFVQLQYMCSIIILVSTAKKRTGKCKDKRFYKVPIISDLHSQFLDERAFSIFLQIYKDNDFDQLIINGDLCDFPTISNFANRIETFNPNIPREYSLDEELDFVENEILKPLHKIKPKIPILIRLGNHEKRFMRPIKGSSGAVSEILETSRRRGVTRLEDLLHLDRYNAKLSYKIVDIIKNRFAITHGTWLSKNRCEKYIHEYLMSGTSGHSHQDLNFSKTTYFGQIQWVESMCLRTIRDIEYMDEGYIPNWSQGFVDVWFEKGKREPHIRQHKFDDYKCYYKNKRYSA